MVAKVDFQKTSWWSATKITLIFLITFANLIKHEANGQIPGKEETIVFINDAIGPGFRISWESEKLRIIQYNQRGSILTQDCVDPESLDLTIFHNEDNNLLCIPCMTFKQQCVTRTLSSNQRKRTMNSLEIPVKDNREFYLLMRAFEHLIRLTSEKGYKNEVVFD